MEYFKNIILNNYRKQQEMEGFCSGFSEDNPALMSELRALRNRKHELEAHLTSLQDSRRQLMVQLEGLMKLLKVNYLNYICIKYVN
jgi:hypothetical protein